MATSRDLTTARLKEALQISEEIASLQEKLHAVLGGTTKRKVGRPPGTRTISPNTMLHSLRLRRPGGQK